ncbi:hypothetical protein ABH920_004378 [Catenulispora sp. EB89]
MVTRFPRSGRISTASGWPSKSIDTSAARPARRKHLRRLRQRCEQHIVDLALPKPSDLTTLRRTLEEHRSRSIVLVPMPMPAWYPCGIWVAAETEELIFYDTNTTSAQQEHIILHELGHIVCGHHGAGLLDDTSAKSLFPNLDPEIVRDMLMRTTYDDVQEQEAEIAAHLLAERLVRSSCHVDQKSAIEESTIERVERALL